jgi:predicted KAP-like P-loop ATPase
MRRSSTGVDTPIRSLSEDRLGRRSFAQALAAEVMAAPVARGYVMGLTGPWGTGKTSILNMTVDAIGDQAVVVQFNPWMFSGTEALVSADFRAR